MYCVQLGTYIRVIQQLRGQNFVIFNPLPLHGQFLFPKRRQIQTFFDPLPLHLVHVVIKWPLMIFMRCSEKF